MMRVGREKEGGEGMDGGEGESEEEADEGRRRSPSETWLSDQICQRFSSSFH